MSKDQELSQSKINNSIAFDIYGLIWKHEHSSNQYTFKVPNTIVFKNQQPILWIYSNSNNQVMKKTTEILTHEHIKGFFNNIKNISGIAAQYIFQINDKLQIKYMKTDEISSFLDQKNNLLQDGILQQFVDPNSQRNSVIQASTNHQSCSFLKLINKKNIYNQEIDLIDRACTFDGQSNKTDSVNVKGKICPVIKQCINEIQSNIILNQEGGQKVKKITCYFKEDEKENLYFLWANYIKVERRSSSQQSKSQIFQRQPIYQEKSNYSSNQSQKNSNLIQELKSEKSLQKHFSSSIHNKFLIECYQCSQKKVKESFTSISYKYLIDYQMQIDQSSMETEKLNIPESVKQYKNKFTKKSQQVYHIPRILQIIHPNLKYPTYVCIKESPHFQNRQVEVCSECYYEIIEKITEKTKQINLQSMRNVKRSISVGNNRSQGSISSYITHSEQKYPHRIRLASAKQNQQTLCTQQFQISPQKIIEDDSECSQPTVFVKNLEKLAIGVHSLSGFQSRNNIDNLNQSNYSTGTNNFNHVLNQVNKPINSQSEAQILNFKYKKSLQSQDSLIKSVNCSNGFAIKKVFSTYSCVEEGMDVPQMSQSSYKFSSQNKETQKLSTKQCTSERQSFKNENIENNQEKKEEESKKISVKGLLESQKLQNQQHNQKEQNIDQANIEDITLFNLVKHSDKKDETYNFLNIQKSPEYSNTPTFQHAKQNLHPNKNDILNKNILPQELNEQPYQFRLSFGSQTFEEYQQCLKAKQIQDSLQNIPKSENKSSKPSFFQDSQQQQQKNEKILISNEQSNFSQDKYRQANRKESQSSSSKLSESEKRKDSQKSVNPDYILEDIQKYEDSSIDQEQNKNLQSNLKNNQEQKDINSIQESILSSEAENPEIKQTQKQTTILSQENQKSGNKTKNINKDLPVNMISNTNHIPIKKERGLFNVKKIQSSSKLNQIDKKN
ncbi:hypothetical protein TTHERM_00149730 (macronuclear) [Tetrahymena thermophila SB210]|uniref:Uncharacterized protein n=1 Tax=Tetrahymena thermophila (strain SB210) TaxID=312017 RepID=I7LWC3_TETTS|nr:hypothetical protein TTHERM_00149730 [Tetrahymena thermophila SB210]EAS01362.2 hypothetical protein TTHERM_00149730 [Tetrahymena thermophila SB210]|eukprot:XP_001021608.2 hypothetical protein TTHERM_00149730 [Tetrahymena thermophila SB210]